MTPHRCPSLEINRRISRRIFGKIPLPKCLYWIQQCLPELDRGVGSKRRSRVLCVWVGFSPPHPPTKKERQCHSGLGRAWAAACWQTRSGSYWLRFVNVFVTHLKSTAQLRNQLCRETKLPSKQRRYDCEHIAREPKRSKGRGGAVWHIHTHAHMCGCVWMCDKCLY